MGVQAAPHSPGQAKALGGMGQPGLPFRMKTRRPFSKPGCLCSQGSPVSAPGFGLPTAATTTALNYSGSFTGFCFFSF